MDWLTPNVNDADGAEVGSASSRRSCFFEGTVGVGSRSVATDNVRDTDGLQAKTSTGFAGGAADRCGPSPVAGQSRSMAVPGVSSSTSSSDSALDLSCLALHRHIGAGNRESG